MLTFGRILISAIVIASVSCFVAFMGIAAVGMFNLNGLAENDWLAIKVIDLVAAFACGLVAGVAVWKGSAGYAPRGCSQYAALGALIVGSLGFAAGFFGPMIHADPKAANVGPLLGLFFTGPAGAALGALGGALYWLRRRARA